ncbi:LRP4 [Mytilus coruscus]|uniref:LRP4 n=1 Tax=Mytilus coruscus TaxID=42192 RepID=A0A6J8B291_MYTCO|nr:LRP4 [Mytilus coruscus]
MTLYSNFVFICYLYFTVFDTYKLENTRPHLIFADYTKIKAIKLETWTNITITDGLDCAISVDYHYEKGLIFWTDILGRHISVTGIKNDFLRKNEAIVRTKTGISYGIAVDWINDHIYWTDETFQGIHVSNLLGGNRRTLIEYAIEKPKGVAINPSEGGGGSPRAPLYSVNSNISDLTRENETQFVSNSGLSNMPSLHGSSSQLTLPALTSNNSLNEPGVSMIRDSALSINVPVQSAPRTYIQTQSAPSTYIQTQSALSTGPYTQSALSTGPYTQSALSTGSYTQSALSTGQYNQSAQSIGSYTQSATSTFIQNSSASNTYAKVQGVPSIWSFSTGGISTSDAPNPFHDQTKTANIPKITSFSDTSFNRPNSHNNGDDQQEVFKLREKIREIENERDYYRQQNNQPDNIRQQNFQSENTGQQNFPPNYTRQQNNQMRYQTDSTSSMQDSYHSRLLFYNGRSDWSTFQMQFEIIAERNNWDPRRQAEEILLVLKDEAAKFASELPYDTRSSFRLLSKDMERRFGDNNLPETYRKELQFTRKKNYKGHMAYYMQKWNEAKTQIRQIEIEEEETSFDADQSDDIEVRRVGGKRFVTEERLNQFGREMKESILTEVTKSVENIMNTRLTTSNTYQP